MKRIGAILSLVLIVVLLSAPLCFAGTLEVTDTYPKDGQSNLQNVNCGVKVYFNESIYSKENSKANKACFTLTDEKGKAVKSRVLYGTKEENMIMVLATSDLEINHGYKLNISDNLVAANGDTLAKAYNMEFRTRDTSKDTMINMGMMGVMMVGMIFFTSRATKKQMAKKAEEERGGSDKVNPYKVSKETGKSVEEIVAKDQKEKKKKAEAEARRKAKQEAAKAKGKTSHVEQEISSENKRVKGPRPVSAGGSTYITGRKAKAEAETAAKEAARAKGTTNPKSKGKNTKKK